jgi:hypothetical protein
MAYKQFTPDVLAAADVNTYLMKQAVVTFASAAARNTALGTSIPIGMVTFLTDSESFWFYDGTNWVNLGISMTYPTATARTAAISAPVEGMQTYLADSNTFWYYNGSAWTNLGNVMRYASYAARANDLPSPVEGMVTYLQDVDELEVYNGTSWLRLVVTSDDEGLTLAGNFVANTGKFVANRANATGGSSAGGIDMQIDGSTYGQIFMTDANTMRFTAAANTFDGGATVAGGLTVDTSSLRVDPSNDVIGIMTASPSTGQYNDWSVDIASGRVRIGGQRSGGTAGISLGTGTPTGTWYNGTAFIGLDGAANSSQVGFWHSGAWRMLITNGGVVTTPFQPVFKAHLLTGGGTVSVANGGIIPLSATSLNVGSCFNTSNYRFTAPISGTYVFGGQLRFDQDQAYIHSMPFVNGAMSRQNDELPGLTGAGGSGQGFTAGVFSYLRYLNTNDYIQFGIYNSVGGSFNVQSQTFIFGYLQG